MKRVIPLLVILAVAGFFGYRAWEKAQEAKHNDLFYGTVEADEVLLTALVPGRVLEFHVEEGQIVSEGDLLVRLDDTTLRAQRAQAEAAKSAATSQRRAVNANLAGVETELARSKKLLATGSGTAMQHDILTAQKDAVRAQAQAVGGQIGQAAAAVATVQSQIDLARVVAPISGTVLRTHTAKGETAFPGSALLVLADLTQMEIAVYIPEPMLGKIKLGGRVEVFHDADPGRPLYGTIGHIADKAEFTPKNVQTRDERVRLIYRVKVDISNPNGVLKIGMPVDVRFLGE